MVSPKILSSKLLVFDPYPALDEFIAKFFLLDSSKCTSCADAYEGYVAWTKKKKLYHVACRKFRRRVAKSLSVEIVEIRSSSTRDSVLYFRGIALTGNYID